MYYQPTPIDFKNYHFLIMSAPDSSSMKKCVQVISFECVNNGVGYEGA